MKKLFLSCVAALCGFLVPQASAQDCCPYTYNDYNSCCDQGSFNGFFVGGNVGVVSRALYFTDLSGLFVSGTPTTYALNATGVTGGVQVGYDWQCNSKLAGLVFDWNWGNTRRSLSPTVTTAFPTRTINARTRWFSTIRARLGLTVCDALIYVTGGAVVKRERTLGQVVTSPVTTLAFNNRFNNTRWGWTVGAGTELMMGCKWSVGGEFLYMNFASKRFSGVGAVAVGTTSATVPATFRFSSESCAWLARFLVNYRFGDLCCN